MWTSPRDRESGRTIIIQYYLTQENLTFNPRPLFRVTVQARVVTIKIQDLHIDSARINIQTQYKVRSMRR